MKKILKWVGIVFAILFIIGVIAAIFETDEQAADRELDTKNKEVAAEQVKAEKLQAKADKQAAKEKEEADKKAVGKTPLNSLVEDNKPDPTIGGKSRMEAFVECQVAIQKQLSNPRSFDVKTREVVHKKYEDGGEHLVGFKFYAKNQFNAESEHMAVCAFDGNGKRLTAEYK